MSYLYQDIMSVPGLTGTWQQRNAQLYKALGAPMGGYTGSYSQNVWLQNQIKNNDFFKNGLPGQQNTNTQNTSGNVLDQFVNPVTDNVSVDNSVYSQDVMPLETWRNTFDAWTQNFVDTYIKPEWEANTYNPAMKSMTTGMNTANQNIGNTGQWRTSGAANSLEDMAKEALAAEEKLRQAFNEQTVGIRDSMNENLADPLYKSNMERYVTAPWRDQNIGQDITNSLGGIDTDAWAAFRKSLQDQGVTTNGYDNPADAIAGLGTWDPTKTPELTTRDWNVKPTTYGSMGTNLYSQYLKKTAAPGGISSQYTGL